MLWGWRIIVHYWLHGDLRFPQAEFKTLKRGVLAPIPPVAQPFIRMV